MRQDEHSQQPQLNALIRLYVGEWDLVQDALLVARERNNLPSRYQSKTTVHYWDDLSPSSDLTHGVYVLLTRFLDGQP